MVRKYKRKREKSYKETQLQLALEAVRTKRLSVSQAAKLYGVPRTTINTRQKCLRDKPGRPTVFSADTETQIAANLHLMEKYGFPLRTKEVSILISEYVRQNGIDTPFNGDVPGKDWFLGFKKRNGLSIKKPQNVEIARRKACDPFVVYGYFEMLEKALEELGLKDKPKQIYNLDETSICNDPIKGKIIGKKGYPATRTTSGPGRNNTTVLLAANASGDKVPPLIIFQGKHLWSEWIYPNENVKTAYAVSEKGWMETSIFEQYMRETFVPALGDIRPILLIFDGHSTHVDLNVIEYAASEGITILKLPPHSSHFLQPLDCSVMKPLKDRWEDEIIKWQRLHIGAKLPKKEFARLLTEVWDGINPIIIQNGFLRTGIFPLNPEAIGKELFDVTKLREWDKYAQLKQDLVEMADTKRTVVPTLLELILKNFNKEIENDEKKENVMKTKEHEEKISKKQGELKTVKLNEGRKANLYLYQLKEDKNFEEVKQTKLNKTKQLYIKENEEKPKGRKADSKTRRVDKPKTCENINQPKEEKTKALTEKKPNLYREKENPKTYQRKAERKAAQLKRKKQETCEKENQPKANETKALNSERKAEDIIISLPNIENGLKHKLHIPSRMNTNKLGSSLQILNTERVSFETLLLKTISKNDPPVSKRRRVTNNKAEILTYKHVIEKIKKEKEEKMALEQNKLKRKMAKAQKDTVATKKPKKVQKKRKPMKKKKQYDCTDSDSTCSYKSSGNSDEEDIVTFYDSILQTHEKDDDLTLPATYCDAENKTATSHYIDYIDPEPSTSSTTVEPPISHIFKDLHPPNHTKLEIGKFILVKFESAKGKKTYKYVCRIEDANEKKIVVLGLKTKKKQNNIYKIINNDYSIIEKKDIIQYLPDPVMEGKDYIFPYKIEVTEKI